MSPVDAEYDAAYALVHDALVGGEETANRLVAEFASEICGSRILDVGAGTGRVAKVLSRIASSVVGVELSTDMLARASGLPDNVTLVQGDFSAVLPVEGLFGAAVAACGSLACVPNAAALTVVASRVRAVLEIGAPFLVEYYAREVYEQFVERGQTNFTIESEFSGHTLGQLAGDELTMWTQVVLAEGRVLEFSEKVLLLDITRVIAAIESAGFSLIDEIQPEHTPFDWLLFRAEDCS